MICRAGGNVKDFLKPLFLFLDPPNYCKWKPGHQALFWKSQFSQGQTLAVGQHGKDACRQAIAAGLINSRKSWICNYVRFRRTTNAIFCISNLNQGIQSISSKDLKRTCLLFCNSCSSETSCFIECPCAAILEHPRSPVDFFFFWDPPAFWRLAHIISPVSETIHAL